MKAIQFKSFGKPEVLEYLDLPTPAPPTIALVGLLGMLAGENVIGVVRACVAHLAG